MFAPRLVPLAVMALLGFGVVLVPVLRMRRRTGSTGVVVHRAPLSTQRLVSAAGGVLAAGAVAWSALVRNPIYAGIGLAAAGLALLTPSPWTLLGAAQAVFVLALQARFEEEHLSRTHGAEYLAYARRVGRFLPGVGRLTS
ncbi:MAG TPA: methyltransferase [Polyangiaceae bacterium]